MRRRFRVSGDVRHAFVHEVEADSAEEAEQIVGNLSHKVLDNVDTSNSGSENEIQSVEEIK